MGTSKIIKIIITIMAALLPPKKFRSRQGRLAVYSKTINTRNSNAYPLL